MTNPKRRLRLRSLTLVPCLLVSAVAFAQSGATTAQQPVSSLDTEAFARSGQVWRSFGQDLPFASPSNWTTAGGGYLNSRFAPGEWKINRTTAKTLKPAWTLTTTGDISATPSVEGGTLYVPDWGGTLYSVDTQTGKPNWQAKLSDYTGNANSVTRNTPAISAKSIIVGDQVAGTLLALDKKTGKLLWKTTVEANPQARITSSPVIYGNRIYVGVSSGDWGNLAANHTFSFRGSVVAVDLNTGKKVWQFYNVPEATPAHRCGARWPSTRSTVACISALATTTTFRRTLVTAFQTSALTAAANSPCRMSSTAWRRATTSTR